MINITKILSSDWLESLAISIVLYSIVGLVLSLITISIHQNKTDVLVIESVIVPVEIESLPHEIMTFDDKVSILKPQSESIISIPENISPISIDNHLIDNISKIPASMIISDNDINQIISIGDTISHDTSIGGVLDRLTTEILYNAKNRNLNVVWLFDASISLSKQRQDIKNRFIKITNELNQDSTVSTTIKHQIVSFGISYKEILLEPTNDPIVLEQAIDKIKLDESGIENIFSAIEQLSKKSKNNTKNIIIAFTDEIGDDQTILDKACYEARKNSVVVYVVGPPAPFGLDKIQFKYIDPDPRYDQTEKWVEINQGPETPFKMTLDLHSLEIDNIGIDSGFGPYGLSKLCTSTGGIYFAVHPNRNENIISKKQISPLASYIKIFFDSAIMRKYPPDYRSLLLQTKEITTNKTKIALLKACQIPINIVYDQKMFFMANDEAKFIEQLNDAQKFSAKIEPKLEQVYSILKEVEQYAKNLSDKRWLVSYNLAMGRILATKCRIELYNSILAEAKSGLKKQNPKSNVWRIEHNINFKAKSSQLEKNYLSAIKYLQSVIDDFPNTPWAYVAKSELDTPMGYKWVEDYQNIVKPMDNQPNNNNNSIPKDDLKKKIEYKPQRNTTKI